MKGFKILFLKIFSEKVTLNVNNNLKAMGVGSVSTMQMNSLACSQRWPLEAIDNACEFLYLYYIFGQCKSNTSQKYH